MPKVLDPREPVAGRRNLISRKLIEQVTISRSFPVQISPHKSQVGRPSRRRAASKLATTSKAARKLNNPPDWTRRPRAAGAGWGTHKTQSRNSAEIIRANKRTTCYLQLSPPRPRRRGPPARQRARRRLFACRDAPLPAGLSGQSGGASRSLTDDRGPAEVIWNRPR